MIWSAAAHAALLVVILIAARYVVAPPVVEQVLPIEATVVVVAERTRTASASVAAPQAKPAPQPKPLPQAVRQPDPLPRRPSAEVVKVLPRVVSKAATAVAPAPVAQPPRTPPIARSSPEAAAAVPAPLDPDRLRREAELRARMAAEEHAEALRASGAVTAWTQSIRGKVERAWLRPPSVTAALDCVVRVSQVPGGEVVRVEIQSCNGDASARESIEAAVYRASPLPQPSDAALFERVIEFRFHPSE